MSSIKLRAPIASTFLLWLDSCLLCLPSEMNLSLMQANTDWIQSQESVQCKVKLSLAEGKHHHSCSLCFCIHLPVHVPGEQVQVAVPVNTVVQRRGLSFCFSQSLRKLRIMMMVNGIYLIVCFLNSVPARGCQNNHDWKHLIEKREEKRVRGRSWVEQTQSISPHILLQVTVSPVAGSVQKAPIPF